MALGRWILVIYSKSCVFLVIWLQAGLGYVKFRWLTTYFSNIKIRLLFSLEQFKKFMFPFEFICIVLSKVFNWDSFTSSLKCDYFLFITIFRLTYFTLSFQNYFTIITMFSSKLTSAVNINFFLHSSSKFLH